MTATTIRAASIGVLSEGRSRVILRCLGRAVGVANTEPQPVLDVLHDDRVAGRERFTVC